LLSIIVALVRQVARLRKLLPPARRFRLASAYEEERRWADAERAYRRLLAVDDRQAPVFARLGRVLERQKRYGEAAEAYRAALALRRRKKWNVRLGKTLERIDREEARRHYEALLDDDPKATPIDHRLLEADARRFPARRRYARFVARNLDEIRDRASAARAVEADGAPRIWKYWAQGIEQAPPVVQRCQEQLLRFHDTEEIVVLDEAAVSRYADVPNVVSERLANNPTKFADVLRFELLLRYGGVWLDATCFSRVRIFDQLPELLQAGFFAFRYRRARISSWMLASEPNHPVVAMTLAAQHVYWELFRRPIDYYVVHHLFESLYYLDDDFRERVLATRWRSSHPSARFARRMLEPYDPALYKRLLEGSFIHKLSYKYPRGADRPDTLLGHLMQGEEPA
jgi:tetratricopeptide (TPR) repeat protein